MGIISNFLARRKSNENRQKDYEDNDKIIGNIEEKKKSHAERELIKVLESEKQTAIKEALREEEKCRQLRERVKAREMMKFNPEFFNNDTILHQKSIFLNGGNF